MLNAQTLLEHATSAGERIARAAEGHLGMRVPSCPEMSVGDLVAHTAAFAAWVKQIVASGQPVAPDGFDPGNDVIAAHRSEHSELMARLAEKDPDAPCFSWGRDQHIRFWYRRAAHELSIHAWDVENAVGEPLPLEPTLAADGVDEFIEEFGPNNPFFKGAAHKFGGDGERLSFKASDLDREWPLLARPEEFEVAADAPSDVVATGAASDLNLFVWGRIPAGSLEVEGDRSLLDRWAERVKI